jgi:serine/threonine protein kinase
VPKGVIYGGLVGFIVFVVVLARVAIGATRSIPDGTDPSVAKTAILGIVIGLVVLVLIIGVVVISVAGIIWGRHYVEPKHAAQDERAKHRVPTPPPAAAPVAGPRQCPVCESMIPDDSPEGLCPKCLLGRCLNTPESPVRSPKVGETTPYNGASPAPLPSDLASRFPGLEIQELLGQGGMGAVYKARQTKLDRLVAVKVLPEEWGRDPAFAERFTREAKALARLNHPHIVAVHDFGEMEGHFYLVMEYVDGANLRNILANGGLEPHEALAIVPQICDALQYAHEEGIVHRDIKPENILLDRKGRVKIADFGLAKLIDKPRANYTLTGSQMVMGTLDYMAPEQRLTPHQVDHRADIYSLGVVFYEMLTGELPLGRFAPPSQKTGVDQRLDGIVFRALEREPEHRYQRISEVKTDLHAISGASGSVAPSVSAPGLPAQQRKSNDEGRIRRASILLVVLAIFGWASAPGWLLIAFDSTPSGNPLFWNASRVFFSLSVLLSGLITFSAWRAWHHKNYSLVVLSTILAMLPWSLGFLLAVPIGYVILRVLGDPAVRRMFADQRIDGLARLSGKAGQLLELEAPAGVLCIPIDLGSVWDHSHPGLLRLQENSLILEYRTRFIRSKIQERVIPLELIRSIQLNHGWFWSSLIFRSASLKALEGIHKSYRDQLILHVPQREINTAAVMLARIHRLAPAIKIELPWGEIEAPEAVPASDARPPMPQSATPTGPVHRKLRSLFNSVYTMFFSRHKNASSATNDPLHEHPAGQP